MKFSTQEVMDVPIAAAFEMLSDFAQLERAARRRGADVNRVDDLPVPGVGQTWQATFMVRDRSREADLVVVVYEPAQLLELEFVSQGLFGSTRMELIALSPARTRVVVSLEMRPSTLPARLFLQTLKLAKPRLTQAYKERVAQYIRDTEGQYRPMP